MSEVKPVSVLATTMGALHPLDVRMPDPMPSKYLFFEDFHDFRMNPRLKWTEPGPQDCRIVDHVLRVMPTEKLDFWQKTYYEPLMAKDDGHICQVLDISEKDFVIETSFLLTPLNQFDQAGLIVHFNADCWVKTGLEYVDGKARLSCVVTNNGYSDWSTQPWPTFELRIRLYKLKHNFVVEFFQPADHTWNFVRIFQLQAAHGEDAAKPRVGVTACAPTGRGFVVDFHYILVTKSEGYHHNADTDPLYDPIKGSS